MCLLYRDNENSGRKGLKPQLALFFYLFSPTCPPLAPKTFFSPHRSLVLYKHSLLNLTKL